MTTTYTFEQLKEDVCKEAEALKVHATKEELENLAFENLKPSNMHNCIYGQMTGYCYSLRAAMLINSCCIRFFRNGIMPEIFEEHTTFEKIKNAVNGTTVDDFIGKRCDLLGESTHFSAIEAYILLSEAKNENLIAFLKGETDNLEL